MNVMRQTLGIQGKARVQKEQIVDNFLLQANFLETIVQGVLALDLYLTGSITSRNQNQDGEAVNELRKGSCVEANLPLSDGKSFLALTLSEQGVRVVCDRDDRNRGVKRRWQMITSK